MDTLINLISHYGLWLIFAAVLLDQGGVPLPAYPIIMVASAMAVQTNASLWPILLVSVLAVLLADMLWYGAGRRFGGPMIRLICRLSLSSETCVGSTRGIYARWGAPSLIVAKFIPGVAAVATTLAGQNRIRIRRFVLYDGIGAALWVGAAIAIGAIFRDTLQHVLVQLESLGRLSPAILLVALALFITVKAWRRRRFLHQIRMARMTPGELQQLMASDTPPVVLDVRAAGLRAQSGWIPGAVGVSSIAELDLAAESEVVVYCDCPNEASAALLARQLKNRGFQRVRPLAGGFEAWNASGLPIAGGAHATQDVASPHPIDSWSTR
ncbi:MAG TPA: VTT domain-containing protein [Salinisphaeraceae bacterium]|nr:VTT domain-containing protein [Salinisphaeraceae bacterium]